MSNLYSIQRCTLTIPMIIQPHNKIELVVRLLLENIVLVPVLAYLILPRILR